MKNGESGDYDPVGADPTPLRIEDRAPIDTPEQRFALLFEIAATGIQLSGSELDVDDRVEVIRTLELWKWRPVTCAAPLT